MDQFIDFETQDKDNQNSKEKMEEVSNSIDSFISFIDDEPICEVVYSLCLPGITRNYDDVFENFEDVTDNNPNTEYHNYFYDSKELDCINDYIDNFQQVDKNLENFWKILHIPQGLDLKICRFTQFAIRLNL